MFYIVKIPAFIHSLYSRRLWKVKTSEKVIYLTFDDGPHPQATQFVLDELSKFNAKATFFCIGKNVKAHPDVYARIIDEEHKAGNHTYDHLNGWKVSDREYLDNISHAMKYIDSDLFRPPYGRTTQFQVRQLGLPAYNLKTVMWTVLSGDFDPSVSPQRCVSNVILKASKGDIVVFHDSEKCYEKIQYALPKVLEFFSGRGYRFESLSGIK